MSIHKAVDATVDAFTHLYNKAASGKMFKSQLHSNEGINKIFGDNVGKVSRSYGADGMFGGFQAAYKNSQEGMNTFDAIRAAHMKKDGGANLGAIAGSYIGLSAAGRVATGGGVYRDRHGRGNIAGIPFF